MKSKKLKGTEPSVRDKLSASFLKAFQNDFEINGIEAIEKLREESPSKYAEQGLVDRALYWCAATAVAVLSDCMATTAIMPAASVTGRSICRKSKTPATRNRLAAAKLRLQLGGWPDIREPLPPRAKRKHKKRYQCLRNQAQALEAKAKQTRFRKEIDIRTFAYHVA